MNQNIYFIEMEREYVIGGEREVGEGRSHKVLRVGCD